VCDIIDARCKHEVNIVVCWRIRGTTDIAGRPVADDIRVAGGIDSSICGSSNSVYNRA